MGKKSKRTFIERPILTPAETLEDRANCILMDVVYGESPHAAELEAEAGQLFVEAAKMRLSTE